MEGMGVRMMMKKKEVLGATGVAMLLIILGCLMPPTMAQRPSVDVCDQVRLDIQPCTTAIKGGTLMGPPTPACCQGLKDISDLAATTKVSKVCQCTKSSLIASGIGPGAGVDVELANACNVNLGFEVEVGC